MGHSSGTRAAGGGITKVSSSVTSSASTILSPRGRGPLKTCLKCWILAPWSRGRDVTLKRPLEGTAELPKNASAARQWWASGALCSLVQPRGKCLGGDTGDSGLESTLHSTPVPRGRPSSPSALNPQGGRKAPCQRQNGHGALGRTGHVSDRCHS